MKATDKILVDTLVKEGILNAEQADEYTLAAKSLGKPLEVYLTERKIVPERKLIAAMAKHLGIETVDLSSLAVDPAVTARVPVKFVWYYKFMPISLEGKKLTIAVSNPLDVKMQDEIRVHLGLEPKLVLSAPSQIQEAIKKHYGLASDTLDQIMTREPSRVHAQMDQAAIEDVEQASEDASVRKLVNQIILEAYKKRATDIHIEPYRDKVRFRYRIDGVLVDANLPADIKHFLAPIISRIKIMSNLSIVEKRIPQDGSAVVRTQDQTLDLRISTIPTPSGESIVIRILPSKVMFLSLEKLGLSDDDVAMFRALIKKPHGIIFVTGPTGSGKTTTLYAALAEVNSAQRKIITIEDPVEYEMEGVTQIQVNPKVELDFARGLRSILRHDPDIIMVGEVRDRETAEIAIRTALTGHLVFSTLHTNDAASGVTRLIEMGLEPFLVSSSIEALMAQRLVRVICPHCKIVDETVPEDIREEIAMALKLESSEGFKVYRGQGCEHCNQTGYYGRTAIYEILILNDAVRAAVLDRSRSDNIRNVALREGMRTMRHDGWRKVYLGVTTPGEVLNVTAKVENSDGDQARNNAGRESSSQDLKTEDMERILKRRYRVIDKGTLMAENEYNSRVYSRVHQKIPVRYNILHGEEEDPMMLMVKGVEHSTVTRDISAGGLMMITGNRLSVGTVLEIKIHLEGTAPPVECLGKVCRMEENSATNLYNVVAYFLDITSADRVRINTFVKERLKQERQTRESSK